MSVAQKLHVLLTLYYIISRQIFLQLCTGGDLFTYISSYAERQCRLLEGEAKYVMYQILKGLVYLHDKSISHRGKLNLSYLVMALCLLMSCL